MKQLKTEEKTDENKPELICQRYILHQREDSQKPARIVPGFSVQSYQKNVVTDTPPKAIVKKSTIGKTLFRMYYNRGDIPVCMEFRNRNKIAWKEEEEKKINICTYGDNKIIRFFPHLKKNFYISYTSFKFTVSIIKIKLDENDNKLRFIQLYIESIDYRHYMPIFFDGLREIEHPYKVLARQGIKDMLEHGKNKVQPVIPQIVLPIKRALNTRNTDIICCTLKILQQLVTSMDMIGETLVPYYRQILPILNVFKDVNKNVGDDIDYSQQKQQNVGDAVQETLQVLERYGGQHAFINIKYIIPTYESCIVNE